MSASSGNSGKKPVFVKPVISTATSEVEVQKVVRARRRLKRFEAACGECGWSGQTPLKSEGGSPIVVYWVCPACSAKHELLPAETPTDPQVDSEGMVLEESDNLSKPGEGEGEEDGA